MGKITLRALSKSFKWAMVIGSNPQDLFNDNSDETKLLTFQLQALTNYLNKLQTFLKYSQDTTTVTGAFPVLFSTASAIFLKPSSVYLIPKGQSFDLTWKESDPS